MVDEEELARVSQEFKELGRLFTSMCPSESFESALHSIGHSLQAGAGPALLSFLALVHPDPTIQAQLHTSPQTFLSKLQSSFESHLRTGRETQVEVLEGAPGVLGGAKAGLGWVQTAEEGIRLVWKLEVEMLFVPRFKLYARSILWLY